jgi:N-acyl-D-aspartate/D-glutamate deacylase
LFDLLLEGGTLIDGSGAARQPADVAIVGDRIAAIGALAPAAARRTLDARGLIVAPGFIDVHNHDEGWLLKRANFLPKTSQGFTSEVLMSDGISYAPLRPETARDWVFYLRPLDALRQSDYRGWRTIAEYLALLDRRTAQNTIALTPFANLRVLACSWRRAAADDMQVNLMRRELRAAMEEGAAGLSTGLDYISQCFATTDEIARVAAAMAPHQGVYVTHVRYKLGTLRGIQEAVEIGRRAGVPVHVSHLKSGNEREANEILTYIDQVATRDVDFSFDIYPYMPGSSLLASLLPYEIWEDGPLAAPARLRDPLLRERFGQVVCDYPLPLSKMTIAWVASRENEHLHGQTLAAFVEQSGKPVGDALSDLLIDENFCVLVVFHVADDCFVEPFLQHPRQMLGSDGIWFPEGIVHPRVYGSATRMLGPLVRERKLFSLEEAIRKMTAYPAQRFGLAGRGLVRQGNFADLVVFDAQRVSDQATYDAPHRLSRGIRAVIVNGVVVVEDGQPASLPEPPGRALQFRRQDSAVSRA